MNLFLVCKFHNSIRFPPNGLQLPRKKLILLLLLGIQDAPIDRSMCRLLPRANTRMEKVEFVERFPGRS